MLLAHNPALKLILLSYSAELAKGIRKSPAIVSGEFGESLRPDKALVLRTDTTAKNNWHTAAGGYVKSASIQGSVTGMAADGLIVDDPFKGSEDSSHR